MDLKRMLRGSWFVRLVLAGWIVCAVSVIVVFKNMELIVHGELYYYDLVFSPTWADPYRLLTWLVYFFLGVPLVLSGIALVSSFFNVEEAKRKETAVLHRVGPPQGIIKRESQQVIEEVPSRVESVKELPGKVEFAKETTKASQSIKTVDNGTSCPHCNKIFSRALVMLDFRGGKNRLVSVCPYCNHVLGCTGEDTGLTEDVVSPMQDKKIERR
jgi:uncharacterized Zn-finger protein